MSLCREEEEALLVDFIRKYWDENHIFTKSSEILRFQHFNENLKKFNFILAHNSHSGEIDGIIGLIPTSHYDPNLTIYNETWGGIWKVRSDVQNNEIGSLALLLFEYFKKYTTHCSIGMSEIAIKFHSTMRYKIDILNQNYLLNPSYSNFKIAHVPSCFKKNYNNLISSEYTLRNIEDITKIPKDLIQSTYYPKKSIQYLIKRFKLHPIYKYSFVGAYDENEILITIFVTRKVYANGAVAIRIVDVFGPIEKLGYLRLNFINYLIKEDAEYLDFMNYGFSSNVLGFDLLDPNGSLIIPNYFEPFIKKNIVLNCAIRSKHKCVIFKADSDQDRPNEIFYYNYK